MDDRTHFLHEVLARTPLRTWTAEFARPPEQILALPSGGWAPVLFDGWALAAMAQRDQEWMVALINRALAGGRPGVLSAAGTLGQLARRADPALGEPLRHAALRAVLRKAQPPEAAPGNPHGPP